MIELVRKPTEVEMIILQPVVEADMRATLAKQDAALRLAMVAERLEPGADFDPNVMAFVRTVPDPKEGA